MATLAFPPVSLFNVLEVKPVMASSSTSALSLNSLKLTELILRV